MGVNKLSAKVFLKVNYSFKVAVKCITAGALEYCRNTLKYLSMEANYFS